MYELEAIIGSKFRSPPEKQLLNIILNKYQFLMGCFTETNVIDYLFKNFQFWKHSNLEFTPYS